jgi:16S rRNA (guanine(1405)-N(7))-methyltransferase
MPDPAARRLNELVASIRKSAKYRSVCEELIRGIGARELAKRRPPKEAIQATRSTLHQVCGAYRRHGIDYAAGLERLEEAARSGCDVDWRGACAVLMRLHASTRERLPILDRFYQTMLADLAPIRSVFDIACGLHPLSIPWMPLAPEAEYHACDVDEELVGFLNRFLAVAGIQGRVEVMDVTQTCPGRPVHLALLLKSLPCLEQLDGDASRRLLERINAEHLLVSFPVRSLGGRHKGMQVNYESRFRELVSGKSWTVKRFEFSTELVFRVTR